MLPCCLPLPGRAQGPVDLLARQSRDLEPGVFRRFLASVSMTVWLASTRGSLPANSGLSKNSRRRRGLTKVSGGWSRAARPKPGTKCLPPVVARCGTPLTRGHKPHHGTGVAWAPCNGRNDGKLAVLIGLRLGRGPSWLSLALPVKSSQESLWRIPAVPGGPAAPNLASHFSILSAGFVVVTPVQVTQMAILRRPIAQTPDLLHVEVENISPSLLLGLNVNFSRCILQRPRRYHDERAAIAC